MERANKEVNRHIRNILSGQECEANWPQMLCMTEKLLNSSVKQPLGASPNALLFGNATVQEPGMMAEMDQMPSDTGKLGTTLHRHIYGATRKTAGRGKEIARSDKRQQP